MDIATRRADGTLRKPRIIWVVRLGDSLYVRSVNGPDAAWYRGARTRMQGHIRAGGLDTDVTFVDADHGLDDVDRRRLPDQVPLTRPRPSATSPASRPAATTIELAPRPATLQGQIAMASSRTWLSRCQHRFGRLPPSSSSTRRPRRGARPRHRQGQDLPTGIPRRSAPRCSTSPTRRRPHVVDRSFAELGRIDVVISNAGYGLFGAAEELTDAQVDHIVATNLAGSIQLIRSALPHLRAQGGGRIIQISSSAARSRSQELDVPRRKWGSKAS